MTAHIQGNYAHTARFSIPAHWLGAGLGVILATAINVALFIPQILAGETPASTPPPAWSDPGENIELFAPVANVAYHSPIDVTGLSRTFEGNVVIRLLDSNEEVIGERTAIGGSVDGFDFFHTYIRFTTGEVQTATLQVMETSGDENDELLEIRVPITILPGQRRIDLHTPAVGADVCESVAIAGYSNTFEANVVVDLRERDGALITESFTNGGTFGVYADFATSLTHTVAEPQPLLVSAYDVSADTGDWIDLARVPVTLHPNGSTPCP